MNTYNSSRILILILILVGILFLIHWLRKKFKVLSLPCVFFVSGEVKSGKTLLSVHLAIKEYNRAVRNWFIRKFLTRIFLPMKYKKRYAFYDSWKKQGFDFSGYVSHDDYTELPPMLYSNIPLAYVKYNKLTIDIVLRNARIPNKSVCLIDEASLFADSQLFKDKDINNALTSFCKLYGHYSHGGKLILDSQCVADNHFAVKRSMGKYLYIYDRKKLPFVTFMAVRELIYSDDNSVQNNFNEDIELSMRKVVIFNRTYDKYDCFCYSVFTDYLPYRVCYSTKKLTSKDDLKCYNIVSLNEFVSTVNNSIRGKYPVTPKSIHDEDLVNGDYVEDDKNNVSVYKEVKKDENVQA